MNLPARCSFGSHLLTPPAPWPSCLNYGESWVGCVVAWIALAEGTEIAGKSKLRGSMSAWERGMHIYIYIQYAYVLFIVYSYVILLHLC